MALLMNAGSMDTKKLALAIAATFRHRKSHAVPKILTPPPDA
jgi:hypothetical protein